MSSEMPQDLNEKMHQAIIEIRKHHYKIIDDWCKAYLAQLYQEGVDIKPGCFILNEQQIWEKDKMITKYWFSLKDDENVK